MPEQQRAVAHHVIDDLVAVDVPLAAAGGARHVQRERIAPADVVRDAVGEDRHRPLAEAAGAWMQLYITRENRHVAVLWVVRSFGRGAGPSIVGQPPPLTRFTSSAARSPRGPADPPRHR